MCVLDSVDRGGGGGGGGDTLHVLPLHLMKIITARYDLCTLPEKRGCVLILSLASATNVGSAKTRGKVTSQNGVRQASTSKSNFNDILAKLPLGNTLVVTSP